MHNSKSFADVVARKDMKAILMWQGSSFSGYKFLTEISHSLGPQKFTTNQVRLHEMQQPENSRTYHNCVLIVQKINFEKRVFFIKLPITEISIGKSMCCSILVWGHYVLVENW